MSRRHVRAAAVLRVIVFALVGSACTAWAQRPGDRYEMPDDVHDGLVTVAMPEHPELEPAHFGAGPATVPATRESAPVALAQKAAKPRLTRTVLMRRTGPVFVRSSASVKRRHR